MNANDHRRRFDLLWSPRQSAALLILCLLGGAGLSAAAAGPFQWIQALPPPEESFQSRIREKIDPNTASAASLRRLRGIGPTYAQAVVDHRTATGAVFRSPEDLEQVKGFGPARVAQITAELYFPKQPTTGGAQSR